MRRRRRKIEHHTEIDQAVGFYGYLAQNVPNDAHFLMNRYAHYPKARNTDEMESNLKHFVKKYGANALRELAKIHPDRDLILGTNENVGFYAQGRGLGQEQFLNASGGGCGCGGSTMASADGCNCEYFRSADGTLQRDSSHCNIHGGGGEHANFLDKGSDYATLFVVGMVALLGGLYYGNK